MNCEQFLRRMDTVLDQRKDIAADRQLSQHAATCESCCKRMQAWSFIDNVVGHDVADHDVTGQIRPIEPDAPTATTSRTSRLAEASRSVMTIAAVVLLAVGSVMVARSRSDSVSIASVEAPARTSIEPTASVEPPRPGIDRTVAAVLPADGTGFSIRWNTDRLWTSLDEDSWMMQSIPAVNVVRQGVAPLGRSVAPLGRSMKRALAILMIQTEPRTMDQSNPNAPGSVDDLREQTSDTRVLLVDASFA